MSASARHGSSRAQAWFCTTGLPSDVVFEVHDMTFHLHKFPLMAKSRKIHRMLTEQEEKRPARRGRRRRRSPSSGGGDSGDDGAAETEIEEAEEQAEEETEQQVRKEGDGQPYSIAFPDFPGGPGTFEAAAKFCYGVRVDLTAWNVAPLRCAAEYLEMTEDHCEGNLAALAEAFLDQTVLRHPGDATKSLKSCEELLPLAEDLGIVSRCADAIAARSSSAASAAPRSWCDDLAVLGLPMYKRVMAAMAERDDVRAEARESCLVSYARGTIPGLSRSMRRRLASAPVSSEVEQKELLEAVVASLPAHRCSGRVVTAKFLFALLRTAHILRASDAARAALERKAGTQLEQATLEDVLIPSYSGAAETLYDVDCVERVVRWFLAEAEDGLASSSAAIEFQEAAGGEVSRRSAVAMVQVGKLVDSYLAEVASDANLKPAKFCDLALSLPDHARIYDDGVYRAVDIYLKTHPRLTAEERDRVVGVVDCRKLTVEACTHAAQNERLPLRAVLQVLFFEQLQLRRAITSTLLAQGGAGGPARTARQQQRAGTSSEAAAVAWRGSTALAQESQVLRLDMDSVASRVQELERECSSMRRAIKNIDGGRSPGGRSADGGGEGSGAAAAAGGWRARHGCKFSTQVCDSHARNVVASRASRMGMSP
ncbi:unnamed protein product [Urochloa decumbens]|uniref:NPH3 domain-containing protein n=1 Tax=Urochloa decumbens TaxID=240449 RepID=A0ABC8X2M4_9POAL